jgi:hypothetical protein
MHCHGAFYPAALFVRAASREQALWHKGRRSPTLTSLKRGVRHQSPCRLEGPVQRLTQYRLAQMIQVMLSLGGFNRAYGDPFFFSILEVAERNGLVRDGKEVVTRAAVRVW